MGSTILGIGELAGMVGMLGVHQDIILGDGIMVITEILIDLHTILVEEVHY